MTTTATPPLQDPTDLLPFDPPDEIRHAISYHRVRVILQRDWWDIDVRTEQIGGRTVEFDAATGERLHVVGDADAWVEASDGDARVLTEIDAELVREPLSMPTGQLRSYYVTLAAFLNAAIKLEALAGDE